MLKELEYNFLTERDIDLEHEFLFTDENFQNFTYSSIIKENLSNSQNFSIPYDSIRNIILESERIVRKNPMIFVDFKYE